MTTPNSAHPTRRITVEISAELYAALVVAKTRYGITLNALTREGLELVAKRYRARYLAEKDASLSTNPTTLSEET